MKGGITLKNNVRGIETVTDDELRSVRGGSIWSGIKRVARWAKDHVVIGLHKLGFKGTF
jgi:hypothetical protein